jgi:8-oxo-dGTP diphosphatase
MYTNALDQYFRGAFSIDLALITFKEGKLKVLLEKKNEEPFVGEFGLPGKLIMPNEDTDKAFDRFALARIGTADFYHKQLGAFSSTDRHPLGRVVTFAYYGLIAEEALVSELPNDLSWCNLYEIPKLSYDHNEIMRLIHDRFKKGLTRHPTVFDILPKYFVLSDMHAIYEQAFAQKIDVPNFRKQVLNSGLVSKTEHKRTAHNHMGRPAQFYAFNEGRFQGSKEEKAKFNFSLF